MKPIAVLTLAVALLIGSATTALASSWTTDEAAALPAHGSVWFGSGLAQFVDTEAQPLHGSVWFGSGLAQFVDTEAQPLHGSVWFGSGLAQFVDTEAQPLHGSVWFGSGLAQFVDTEAQPLHGSVWFGSGLAQYGVQIAPVNSFDTAMIARGSAHDQVNVQSAALAQAQANAFDEAMLQR